MKQIFNEKAPQISYYSAADAGEETFIKSIQRLISFPVIYLKLSFYSGRGLGIGLYLASTFA